MTERADRITLASGRRYRRAPGLDCSLCGANDGPDCRVYRAALVDADRVYFPRLCGYCLEEVDAEQTASESQLAAAALLDLMPDEYADGVVTMLEDHGYTDR